jgi:hypothetical protein
LYYNQNLTIKRVDRRLLPWYDGASSEVLEGDKAMKKLSPAQFDILAPMCTDDMHILDAVWFGVYSPENDFHCRVLDKTMNILIENGLIEENGKGGHQNAFRKYTITDKGRELVKSLWSTHRCGFNPFEVQEVI